MLSLLKLKTPQKVLKVGRTVLGQGCRRRGRRASRARESELPVFNREEDRQPLWVRIREQKQEEYKWLKSPTWTASYPFLISFTRSVRRSLRHQPNSDHYRIKPTNHESDESPYIKNVEEATQHPRLRFRYRRQRLCLVDDTRMANCQNHNRRTSTCSPSDRRFG